MSANVLYAIRSIAGLYLLSLCWAWPVLGAVPAPADYDGDGQADLCVFGPRDEWFFSQTQDGFARARFGGDGLQVLRGDHDGDGHDDLVLYEPQPAVWHIRGSQGTEQHVQFGWSETVPVPGDYDGDGTNDLAVYFQPDGTWYIQASSAGFSTFKFGWWATIPVAADYDGDGRTDPAVYHPATGTWSILGSLRGFWELSFGWSAVRPVPADYDGDGEADPAVYYPDASIWYMLRSRDGFQERQFGWPGVMPVPSDYDGDGATDIAVFDADKRRWYVLGTDRGFWARQFGWSTHGDYDGDGRADLVLFHREPADWYTLASEDGFRQQQFGWSEVEPVQGDFDGDGVTDVAVYHQTNGMWYVMQTTAGFRTAQFGWWATPPVPGDYDGDGKTDLAVWHPETGLWSFMGSRAGFWTLTLGSEQAIAVPADYDGDGRMDPAVFYGEPPAAGGQQGTWHILPSATGFTPVAVEQFGWAEAVPVPADYDGDGRADLSVCGVDRVWYVRRSSDQQLVQRPLPVYGRILVPRDFDADGASDFTRYEQSTGVWTIHNSASGGSYDQQFGWQAAVPIGGVNRLAGGWDAMIPLPDTTYEEKTVDVNLPFDQDWVLEADFIGCSAGVWDRYLRNDGAAGLDMMTGRPDGMMLRLANGSIWFVAANVGSINNPYGSADTKDHVAGTLSRYTFSGDHTIRLEYLQSRMTYDPASGVDVFLCRFFWDGELIGEWTCYRESIPRAMTRLFVGHVAGGELRYLVGPFISLGD